MPSPIDSRAAEPWAKAVWAKYIDWKKVTFQPKTSIDINLDIAELHLQAVMSSLEYTLPRRLVAVGYLCSLWFDNFEIAVD